MYLEQMLPHLSIDRELVEEEAKTKTRFAEVPESFMGLKDGAYWIPSQKLHNMVTTAIRYRNEKDGKGNETIYFLLKDWNELRIRYEGPCRLPKDVLVTLSPYQAIAPVVNKKPYGRFRTEMTGVIDLS